MDKCGKCKGKKSLSTNDEMYIEAQVEKYQLQREEESHHHVWLAGKAQCSNCGKEYIGVFHQAATINIECPQCGLMTATVKEIIQKEVR